MKQLYIFIILLLISLKMQAQDAQGGGVYINNGEVNNSLIIDNQAHGEGSGIYATGTSKITNSTISENKQIKKIGQIVGDAYDKGVIFYVDKEARKALVVSLTEGATGSYASWGEIGQNISNAGNITDGKQNSDAIISAQVIKPAIVSSQYNDYDKQNINLPPDTAKRAAHWCYEFRESGKSDWFLPAREQLKKLYAAKDIVNQTLTGISEATILGNGYYWSSTQANEKEAWYIFFDNGETNLGLKSTHANVRPIREIDF